MSYEIGIEQSPKDFHKEQLISELNELHEKFDKNNDEIIDQTTGLRILNGDTKHLWFRDNVAMYFATGRIFDDKDKELLTNILSYFDSSKRTYLGNFYKVLNFNNPVIEGFEKKLNIGNGNYHFILIIVSYPVLEDIQYAPDTRFMNRGVVEYFVDTDRIKQRMIEIIREYGLTAQLEREFEEIDPITPANSFTHKDIQFDIRDNIDTTLMEQRSRESFERVRHKPSDREKSFGMDSRNMVPLNKRIAPKGSDVLSIPIIHQGIYSRNTDTLQIDKNQHTFQLYDDDDEYVMRIMPG